MKPSVGRIVHYFQPEQVPPCRAAIVTAVWASGSIDVTVFPPVRNEPYGVTDLTEVPPHPELGLEGRGVDSWHWPERVEEAD
jgi:hypothetical protein